MSAGYAAANLVLGLILQAAGAHWSVPIYTMVSAAALGWTLTLRRDPPPHRGRPRPLRRGRRRVPAQPAVRRVPGGRRSSCGSGSPGAWNFLSLRIEDAGGGPLLVGLGAALGGVAEVFVMRGSSRLSERIGLRGVFAAGCRVYGTALPAVGRS